MSAPGDAQLTWRLTDDAAAVHALHCRVLEGAPTGMVRPDPLSHFVRHATDRGRIAGCYTGAGELVAYGVLGMESPTVGHLAELLGAERRRFAVLDGAATLPAWRGHHLHVAAVDERVHYAGEAGRTLLAATVSPLNVRSLRSLFHAGFEVRLFAVLYGGLDRLVVQRDTTLATGGWLRERSVDLADVAAHRAALDDGLAGYACERSDSGAWVIAYGRRA